MITLGLGLYVNTWTNLRASFVECVTNGVELVFVIKFTLYIVFVLVLYYRGKFYYRNKRLCYYTQVRIKAI